MRRPGQNHTAAFKAKVTLAALKGDKALAELAEKYDVHANQVTQWKTQLLIEVLERAGQSLMRMPVKITSVSG